MSNKQSKAAVELIALINELKAQAEASQEMNRVYRDFIQSQALRIQILETEMRIQEHELATLRGANSNVL